MAAGGDQHRAAQHPGPTTAVLIAAMSLCVLLRPPRSLVSAVKTALGAYVFTDAYLNLLHMFLDQERNAAHVIPPIRSLAANFQQHHANTTETFYGNHMLDIDALVSTVVLTNFAWHGIAKGMRRSLPRSLDLWTLLVCLFGELAIYNHSLMHARNHGLSIPGWVHALQDGGILVKASFHRVHHTTFDENFAFLVGASAVYDEIYAAWLQHSYTTLHALFWAAQPHTIISIASSGWLFATRSRISGEAIKAD